MTKVFKFAIFLIAINSTFTTAIACFDDKSLLKQTLNTSSLVYVWSPRMVLSVTQAHLAAAQAKALGLQFVPVVDGRLPVAEWQSALKQVENADILSQSEPLCASQLIEKDAYLHFPTAFVVQNGDIHPQKLVGAMPANFWRQGIEARLKPSQCIPQNQFIALDPKLAGLDDNSEVALGAYERVSPDGRFVLRSYSGKRLTAVTLVELPGPVSKKDAADQQRMIETPFANEAFPVQGSWRYLVDTNGEHYEFSSILRNQNAAKPLFKGGMTGFYAAASEVESTYPLRTSQPIRIRSLSWPNANGSTETQGEGMLTARTLTVDPRQQNITADSGRVNLCLGRVATDGPMYALPMISVDGTEFATLPQMPVAGEPTMRLFAFGADGKQCEPQGQFKSQSGKVIFGFSNNKPNVQADVAYEYRGQIWWYQRSTSTPHNLAPWEGAQHVSNGQNVTYKTVLASAFPGITRDGRVVYAATWKRCVGATCQAEAGYVVSDPWQSNAYKNQGSAKSCISVQDVARERAAFAAFHDISN